MESRLKERLTGAVILVALIVLIVPEIYRRAAPTSAAVPPAARSDAPAAPTRSYTIELAAPPAAAPPAAMPPTATPPPATPPGAVPPAAAPPPAAPSRAASATPQAGAESHPVPARQAAAQGGSRAHASRATQSARTAPAKHAAAAAAASAPLSAAPAKVRVASESAAHSRSGSWTVQLGLFANESNAERLAHTAQSHGFTVQISRFGPRNLYRVAVAGIADRASAEQLSHRLRGAGLPAAILGPR